MFMMDILFQIEIVINLNHLFILLLEAIQQPTSIVECAVDLEVLLSVIFLASWVRQMLFTTSM
jgi:hypothetical protein